MHRLIRANALLVLALLSLTGCELLDPPEPAPAYIRLSNPRVELDSVNQFYSSIGIRNVWLYHGGVFQGLYSVFPDSDVVIPVIDLERSDFILEGGIYETGQSAYHLPYAFWKRVNLDMPLTALDTFTIDLRFEYVEERRYDLRVNESFEGSSVDFVPFSLSLNEPGGTFMNLRSDAPFQGTGYAQVDFGPGDRYFQAINSSPFSLTRGKQVFGEITYRNSIPLTVGLLYQNDGGLSSRDVITLSATNSWNTVYVHFVDLVRQIVNTGGEDTAFWLYLKADSEDKEGYIALDDVRLITER